jgi:hypothetical protein
MNIADFKFLISLAFGAGGAWFLIKQSRKDVNGLGNKVNFEIKQTSRRYVNVTLALMLLAPDDFVRRKIAELLREDE